jgi:CheY-like chemotaxis protein
MTECILVVDDEHQSREMHAEALRTWGYKSVVAHDGLEALLKVAEQSPDLVVSDLRMPRMSGFKNFRTPFGAQASVSSNTCALH